mmetsp:Transcript_14683/g.20165  ORF Transcript_14683/g.20165 Transcript_14683/m.20165 type:complete len:105 (+) Transcript_14683:246-560(+)
MKDPGPLPANNKEDASSRRLRRLGPASLKSPEEGGSAEGGEEAGEDREGLFLGGGCASSSLAARRTGCRQWITAHSRPSSGPSKASQRRPSTNRKRAILSTLPQ